MVHPAQHTFRIHRGLDSAHESKEEEDRNKLCKIKVLVQIYTYMSTVANVEVDEENGI